MIYLLDWLFGRNGLLILGEIEIKTRAIIKISRNYSVMPRNEASLYNNATI